MEKGENMKEKLLSLALLVILTLSMAVVFPATATKPANSIYIDPETLNFNTGSQSVGYKFNITVWMHLDTDSFSWQVKIVFPKTWLKCNKAGYAGAGGVDSDKSEYFAGLTTVPLTPVIDNGAGTVLHGESLQGSISAPPADKRLMWAEFEIIAAPGKYETLTGALDINNIDTYVLNPSLSEIPITKYGATLTYEWTQPAKPTLAVSPTLVQYGPYPPPAVGQEFDIQVKIMGLDAAWNLHNASFTLSYNSTLISVVSTTVNPAWTTSTVDTSTPGVISVVVKDYATPPPYGDVLVITVRFKVEYQGAYPAVDISPLNLGNIELWDTIQTIPTNAPVNGQVKIIGLLTLPLPYLEVSSVTMGPGPARGELFNVTVSIKNLDEHWYLVGVDFRLSYDPALITPVAAYEGPFMPYWSSQQPGSLGTFWVSYFESDGFGPHVLIGNLIYPNETGRWNEPFPSGEGVVAIITFRVEYQSFGEPDLSCPLEIIEQTWAGLDGPATQNIVDVPYDDPVNGTYTITTNWPGRMIDVYTQYPAPYGGQGLNKPSDMFWPQKEVELYANVTYNYWPVQQKDVAFEIRDPHGDVWAILTARTDDNGVAHTSFRIPWPCDNPEDLFGVWTVTATVDIACTVVNDTLTFHFDYLAEIFKVTTDKFEYNHCEYVTVNIKFGTHAQQTYPLVLFVVIKDELNVPIGYAIVSMDIGGATYCQYKNYTVSVHIHVPKFAAAGIAKVYVTAYNKLPSQGGFAYCPTYGDGWPIGATIPEIAIQPY